MNKEQRKMKQVVRGRKRQVIKKKALKIERDNHRRSVSIEKHAWLKDKKALAKRRIADRQARVKELRKILHIPDNEHPSLEKMATIYENTARKNLRQTANKK